MQDLATPVWERRNRSEAELAAAVRYCLLNRVKHGFVERAEDWAWSSVRWDTTT
ncbi:MAG: hypothetical protein AAFY80_11505 [Pseudomonadota bacterium]